MGLPQENCSPSERSNEGYENMHPVCPTDAYDPIELEQGTQVELEHTNDPSLASMIARHHLDESPEYYQKLSKMEKTF